MMVTVMGRMTLFALVILPTIRTMNDDTLKVNVSQFCAIVNDCLDFAAQFDKTESQFGLEEESEKRVCYDRNLYCVQSEPRSEDITIVSSRRQFCRIIQNCYKSETVEPEQWCPYSGFCDHVPLYNIDTKTREHSCCKPCSCEPSCRLKRNCCFQANYTSSVDSALTCVKVDFGNSKSIGYYMKNTCLNGSTCLTLQDREPLASSQEKQLIYPSEDCGRCNGAEDVEAWANSVRCLMYQSSCRNTIVPPDGQDIDWTMQYLCSDSIIRTCDPLYPNEEVIKACHETNAIVLTESYKYPKMSFANIFCVACNFVIYQPHMSCNLFRNDSKPGGRIPTFSMILDLETKRNAVTERKIDAETDRYCTGYTVKNIGEPGCRLLYCATGMVLVTDGVCRYIAIRWYHVLAVVQVRLRPIDKVSVSASHLRNISSKFHISEWLIAPFVCLKASNEVLRLSLHLPQDARVTEMFVDLDIKAETVTPAEIISGLEQCVDAEWKLILGKTQYTFSSSFNGERRSAPNVLGIGNTEDNYEIIYARRINTKPTNTMILNKLYFCDQVELHSEKYELYQDKNRIRLLHNNLTLGSNTFDLTDEGARICVDDYLRSDVSADAVGAMYSRVMLMSLLIIQIFLY